MIKIIFFMMIGFLIPLSMLSGENEQIMTVDAGTVLRPVSHCANGSLYGVTEKIPGDINKFVAPLNPHVFTAPARAGKGFQQPVGAAIPVAQRLAATSGLVMIRLADICPNWPYTYPTFGEWSKQVTEVIKDKQASGLKNFYGYELWNEPNATWLTDNGSFNKNLWIPTFKLVRQLDPDLPIIGPSYSEYNHGLMKNFLKICKENNTLPEIICWHELGGDGGSEALARHLKDYRDLEASMGITERKIAINEYCDPNHNLEGQPGSSARYIAKFERYKVDSACISWWFTDLPGRLGSLITRIPGKPVEEAGYGSGWWFYKWYGDMTGNMISVTPPDENSKSIDGFACLTSDQTTLSLCVGGPNNGALDVNFTNLPQLMGSKAIVKIESINWKNKNSQESGPIVLSTTTQEITKGQMTVKLSGLNSTSGYRILLSKAQ